MAAYGGGNSGGGGGRRMTLAAAMAMRAPSAAPIRAEAVRAADEVVLRVQPTEEAERRRQNVIAYLKHLFGTGLGCEVFAFGSVPLKTYLPDGDIDITLLGNTSADSTFISEVRSILELEEKDYDAELELKGLQFIDAEVKLIKCVIDNIVVDISFNQTGGVSTLCFLELVDQEIGKKHLFKRSIMLIKAWCYHESRILGAHRGLISTYALETLVLYIFNMFHKCLHSPVEALYKFLEYFSKFDWDNYCISLNGPVLLSSLPNLTAEPSGIHDELLFGKDIPDGSFNRLIVLKNISDGLENFRLKHLNIIDPLKSSNNLGRSVSKGSFHRIRSAFSFGAQKLGHILMLPSNLIPTEIFGFFANTLRSHGGGKRSDIGNDGSFKSSLGPEYALGEDASDFKKSDSSEDENMIPDLQRTSDSYFCGDAQDRPWNKIWFMNSDNHYYSKVSGDSFNSHSSFSPENDYMKSHCKDDCAATDKYLPPGRSSMEQHIYANNQSHILTPSTRINTLDASSSCPAESNRSDLHEQKLLLSPSLPSNLLDLSGDLDLPLGCLRIVQFHLESLFDGLAEEKKNSAALNNDSFKIPTESSSSSTDERAPGPLLFSSALTERRNLSPVYYSHSTGHVSQNSAPHTLVQVNAVCQQNVALSSGTNTIFNGLTLPPSCAADSENYPASPFHNTGDIVGTHGTGMYIPNNVSLLSGTNANALAQLPFPAADSEDYYYRWYHTTTDDHQSPTTNNHRWPTANNHRWPTANNHRLVQFLLQGYRDYKEHIFYDKGRRQREMLPDRYFRQSNSPELGCSSSSNGGSTVEYTSRPTRQQDYSSRSVVPAERGFGQGRAPANYVTRWTPTRQPWNVRNNQHGYGGTKMNMVVNQKPGPNEGLVRPNGEPRELPVLHPSEVQNRETRASSSRVEFPHCVGNGEGNFQEYNTCQPSSPLTEACYPIISRQAEGLEFGSLGPISSGENYIEAFPPLPARKVSAEAHVSAPVNSSPAAEAPVSTPESSSPSTRSKEFYQLRDEADFPPLKADSHNGFKHIVGK
uniref:Polymerase nucleotidyl transferase domain-containing protein n=1 Tax=Leersia perrieri TaxID=77586 RepID=A0A0D9X2Y3_9ORYZ